MKKNMFLVVIIIIFLDFCSKEKKIDKLKKSDICACTTNVPPPPLIENQLLSTGELEVIKNNKKHLVLINLIADKLVDYNGQEQQIFKLESTNKFRKLKFHFVLPIIYNKLWNEVKIHESKNKAFLEIKIKEKKTLKSLYKIYPFRHKVDSVENGIIVVKSIFTKYETGYLD